MMVAPPSTIAPIHAKWSKRTSPDSPDRANTPTTQCAGPTPGAPHEFKGIQTDAFFFAGSSA
jgi:hypothetical protein